MNLLYLFDGVPYRISLRQNKKPKMNRLAEFSSERRNGLGVWIWELILDAVS